MSRNDTARADAGLPQPLETTHQQRQQELEELADIVACIYGELTPEQRAKYVSDCVLQVAA